jgi:hypothetical protein
MVYFKAFYYLSLPLASSFSSLGSSHGVGSRGRIAVATVLSTAVATVVPRRYPIAMGPAIPIWVQIGFPCGFVEWGAAPGAIVRRGFGFGFGCWGFGCSHSGDEGCVGFEELLYLLDESFVCQRKLFIGLC